MKCSYCGSELNEQDQACPFCGKATAGGEAERRMAEGGSVSEVPAPMGATAGFDKASPEPPKKKPAGKIAAIAVAAAAVIGIGAFAVVKMTEKDPKEVVIAAFENIYTEDQVSPLEELFGVSGFQQYATAVNQQVEMELMLDECSEETVNNLSGGGFRTEFKYDKENQQGAFDLSILFNRMNLITMNAYYGDETIMAAVPELSGKVFTLDVSEGLVERLENSPTLGPVLASSDIDVEALADFYQEYMEWIQKKIEDGTASDPYGLKDAWRRYQEGSKAQENFKAALTVEKAEKGTFRMDGKDVNCKGYRVHISKDSMISFLETSADFFLQDEQLKENFLENLRMSLRMLEITSQSDVEYILHGLSVEEHLEENYEEVRDAVDDAIEELDSALSDVEMLVHVDSKGRLACVEGTTSLDIDDETVDVEFYVNLQGGSYLTQNAQIEVELAQDKENVKIEIAKKGTYDRTQLTNDWEVDWYGAEEDDHYSFTLSNAYSADDGGFTVEGAVTAADEKIVQIAAEGVVSELEKGSVLHMDLDEIRIDAPSAGQMLAGMDENFYLVLSGEYDLRPLEDEIEEPSGEKMDVLAATESDWQRVAMEAYMGIMDIASQLQSVID